MRQIFVVCCLLAACNKTETKAEPKGKVIKGSVDVKADLKASVAATDTIFVIARKGAGGPPLAVKKLAVGEFPIKFELTESDVMMGGPFEGEVELTIRVDKDGDAMTKNPGDLLGKSTGKIAVGDTDVKVTLDTTLP